MVRASDPTPNESMHRPRDPAADSARDTEDEGHEEFDSYLAQLAAAPSVAPGSRRALTEGDRIGEHYEVVRQLGSGGMGVVYLAHDNRLQRKVAIKLQLGGQDARDVARLAREATAMATVSHPNVVSVFEVGDHEGRVFIAMEFVDGGTLQDWIDSGTASWREVAKLFAEIARGLHAAHLAGLVHRDFKPANVLIGSDGRPRIADFGLALGQETSSPALKRAGGAARPSDLRLTATGAVVGTPAYMAPEQFLSLPTSAASDQFAFCVALYEALYGRRPFVAKTIAGLAELVTASDQLQRPSGTACPKALFMLLKRGLSPHAADRFASLGVLRQQLLAVSRRRQRRLVVAMLGLAALATGVGGYRSALMLEPGVCDDAADSVSWRAERSAALGEHLAQSAADSPAAAHVLAQLDDYATGLALARSTACRSAKLEGQVSDATYDLQTACFARLDTDFGVLVEELGLGHDTPDPTQLLRPIAGCEDVEQLARAAVAWSNPWSRHSAHQTPQLRAAHESALTLLERARLRLRVDLGQASALLDEVAQLVEEHGFDDLDKRVHFLRAKISDLRGEPLEAQRQRNAGMQAAARAGDLHGVAALALDRAEAAVDGDRLELGRLHYSYFEALRAGIGVELLPEKARAAKVVHAKLLLEAGDAAAAIAAVDFVDEPGITGTTLRPGLSLVSRAQRSIGAYAQAYATDTRVLDSYAQEVGTDDIPYAEFLTNTAISARHLGRLREADQHLVRAEQIVRESDDHVALLSIVLTNLGRVYRQDGQLERALAEQLEALTLGQQAFGESHARLAYVFDELGELERLRGDFEAALGYLRRALEIRDIAFGPNSAQAAATLTLAVRVYLDQGRFERAQEMGQLAVEIGRKHAVRDDLLAQSIFEVARARRALGHDAVAAELAGEVRQLCASAMPVCMRLRAKMVALSTSRRRTQGSG